MAGRSLIVGGVLCGALILLCAVVPARDMGLNCELYGILAIRGRPPAAGTRIEAYTGGTFLADTTLKMAGHYEISIPPDDPVTYEKDGWSENDEITILIAGEAAQPAFAAKGGRHELDLSIQFISDVRRSTWGKIKALFR